MGIVRKSILKLESYSIYSFATNKFDKHIKKLSCFKLNGAQAKDGKIWIQIVSTHINNQNILTFWSCGRVSLLPAKQYTFVAVSVWDSEITLHSLLGDLFGWLRCWRNLTENRSSRKDWYGLLCLEAITLDYRILLTIKYARRCSFSEKILIHVHVVLAMVYRPEFQFKLIKPPSVFICRSRINYICRKKYIYI